MNKENILPFPEGEDWFVWRTKNGELVRLSKGRYAIVQTAQGKYEDHYISPDMGEWEDAVLEFGDITRPGGNRIIAKVEIKSRKDYEELLQKCERLEKRWAEEVKLGDLVKSKGK